MIVGVVLALGPGLPATASGEGPASPAPLDPTRPRGRAVFIVELRLGAGANAASIRSAQDRLLGELAAVPHRVARRYTSIPFIALELSEAALRRVIASPLVAGVSPDVRLSIDPPRSAPPSGPPR